MVLTPGTKPNLTIQHPRLVSELGVSTGLLTSTFKEPEGVFLKVFLGGHIRIHVLFWGYWFPSFRFLVMSPLGFKARVNSALLALWR